VNSVPQPAEVDSFLEQFRQQRTRLVAMAQPSSATVPDELAHTLDEIGEELLVADQELRVQSEHIEQSARQLDRLVAAYEQLFADAPTAYVQTHADGMVVRVNRAAARLLGIDPNEMRSRSLPGLLRLPDRPPVRQMLNQLPSSAENGAAPKALEAIVVRPDGRQIPVVLTARAAKDTVTERPTIHWELREARAPHPSGGPRTVLPRNGQPACSLMAEMAAELSEQDTVAGVLQRVVERAAGLVSTCPDVGVLLVRSRRRIETPAATVGLAAACDRLQRELGEGPGLTAAEAVAPLHIPDLARDRRWPRFTRPVVHHGVRSLLAIPLTGPRGTIGALSLYARTVNAFEPDDAVVAAAFATHAALAVSHAELEANLRLGLATREEIGRAVGILMERHRVTAAAAFDMLVVASQQSHRKLRDIAAWMNETGEDPGALVAEHSRGGVRPDHPAP
jgi:PAS domain S-box-containing protein